MFTGLFALFLVIMKHIDVELGNENDDITDLQYSRKISGWPGLTLLTQVLTLTKLLGRVD